MRAPLLCFLSALVDADGPASTTAATSASPAVHRSFEGNGDWLIREDGASKSDSTWCWRTVEIGSWFQSGRALAEVVPINVTEDQAEEASWCFGTGHLWQPMWETHGKPMTGPADHFALSLDPIL